MKPKPNLQPVGVARQPRGDGFAGRAAWAKAKKPEIFNLGKVSTIRVSKKGGKSWKEVHRLS